jgi:hypothetical protein
MTPWRPKALSLTWRSFLHNHVTDTAVLTHADRVGKFH